jgi:xanthine dehydrogenase accessory factor
MFIMDIYEKILRALDVEPRVMLATIISTSGSTPAAALSKMLVKQGGIVSVGTVGGGCMEGDVLLHAHRLYDSNKAEILSFHLNEDDVEHGLICGGTLDVLIEPLTGENISLIKELKAKRDDGQDCLIATLITRSGSIERKMLIARENGTELDKNAKVSNLVQHLQSLSISISLDTIIDAVSKAHRRQETQRLKVTDGELLLEPVAGLPRLIIFGGGHVAKYISRAAAMAGFRVTVVDDREKFANPQRFPEATSTLATDFLESFNSLSITPLTYIVIVTRGHRHDEEILERAVKTPAKYIGMIGSQRKVMATFKHLMERGTPESALWRVCAPVGLDIGAVTAEEIGVSIVAQLIAVRRGEQHSLKHKSGTIEASLSRSAV